jgi:hypothetical protein
MVHVYVHMYVPCDYAALNVARACDHEEEGCSMHNNDKEARYAVGDLHRTRQG